MNGLDGGGEVALLHRGGVARGRPYFKFEGGGRLLHEFGQHSDLPLDGAQEWFVAHAATGDEKSVTVKGMKKMKKRD